MSPRDLLTTRVKNLLLTGAAIVGAVMVITGPVVSGGKAIDARYVKQQAFDHIRHVDSITLRQEIKELRAEVAQRDTGVMRVLLDIQRRMPR